MSTFPITRLRRLRKTPALRNLVRETELNPGDFIYPLFVVPGSGIRKEVSSMPGVFQLSVDQLAAEADDVLSLGIPGVLLFGLPEGKDECGSGAFDENGIVQQATRALKAHAPGLMVVADTCMCEYTSHGHCGRLDADGYLNNDLTLDLLSRAAVSQAAAGADIIAPSDMMDGRVAAIRAALDAAGFELTPIMSYAAKFASGFYGPFRDAADSAPAFGDRRQYQMDPANRREALREMVLDAEEGADILMVKPALAYLDIIREARDRFDHPLAAYNVSGEYAMVHAAARNGWIDGDRVMMEILTGIKRAGAEIIITYHAKAAAKILKAEG
jgi:porphobilinogen synthase